MLLEILGVDRERVIADFLESNTTFSAELLSATQLAPVFETIDKTGGIDGFMREVIGLSPSDLKTIREDLLED